jgi:hypothetical protein
MGISREFWKLAFIVHIWLVDGYVVLLDRSVLAVLTSYLAGPSDQSPAILARCPEI